MYMYRKLFIYYIYSQYKTKFILGCINIVNTQYDILAKRSKSDTHFDKHAHKYSLNFQKK